ncbi:MAG TPA: response regulator transcription factor [Burkholderiaceae bacterium]|nr:response regulator transcription factor [Burkholderiaceae bacterium]
MATHRIAIVAGAPLVQAGLSRAVAGTQRFELVAVAPSMRALQVSLARQSELQVDVAIVDPSAADEAAALAAALAGGMRLVLLSDAEPAQLAPLVAAGAACLPTGADSREIAAAAEAVASGLVALRSELFDEMLHKAGASNERRPVELVEPLTPRELQVLRLLAGGFANKHIAHDLGISEHTAKFHVGRILGKLDAATRAEAVAIGLRDGLIEAGGREDG